MELGIFIISLVIAFVIVNIIQQLYMKAMGADLMFFSGKKKIIVVLVIALIIAGSIGGLFGIN